MRLRRERGRFDAMKRAIMRAARGGALGATLASCALFVPQSRVKSGQLYRTGSAKYDAYFSEVHDAQIDAATWLEERRAARKQLIDALTLTNDADDSVIAQLAHEQLGAAEPGLGAAKLDVSTGDAHFEASGPTGTADAVVHALETTARSELGRARKLDAVPAKLEELQKQGHELEPHVQDDFASVGGQKPFAVKQELDASLDVLDALEMRAKREARAATSFVADLQRAVAFGAGGEPLNPPAAAAIAKRPVPKGTATAMAKPPPKPAPAMTAAAPKPPPPPPTDAPPPPKPAPKPPPASESFDP
jgi:hypothetical protein